MASLLFEDEDFQDALVVLLCGDVKSLRECSPLLHPDDFKPIIGMKNGRARWIAAELALEHFRKHHEPIGRLLSASALEYAGNLGLSTQRTEELAAYCKYIRAAKPSAPDAVVEKVLNFKEERLKAAAIRELGDLQSSGQLTNEKWHEVTHQVLAARVGTSETVDYLNTLSDRIDRRRFQKNRIRRPWTFIDPLDSHIQGLAPKELGLIFAPYKRGKSLMLQWLTVAYILQHLNVLYITLENPLSSVEDRLDSIITHIPIKVLDEYPRLIAQRFRRFRSMVKLQLKIHDGTLGGVSVPRMEQIILAERDKGFIVDALIVDYDDEIAPVTKQKERRFEFADIYRDLRQLTARYNLISWTAAQTQRDTEHLKILSGDRAAEDISKLRKVSLAIGMGRGDWEDGESIYLWVAAANNDTQHVGCHIMPDRKRMLVYDRDATMAALKKYGE